MSRRGAPTRFFALPLNAPAEVNGRGASSTAAPLVPAVPLSMRRDPSFGPLGMSPVEREVEPDLKDYAAFAASGALCTSLVRTFLVPLDVAKTLI